MNLMMRFHTGLGVTIDLDKEGEEDSSMQVSQIKLNGNVAQVRIEVIYFTHFHFKSNSQTD